MNKVHARRLLKLADFLDALPHGRFHLGHWVGHSWKGKPDLSCGTTACALGWATTIPEFRKLGVRMKGKAGDAGPALVGKRGSEAYDVSKRLFGLTYDQHWLLFFPSAYPMQTFTRPWDVAARIRGMVDEELRMAKATAKDSTKGERR